MTETQLYKKLQIPCTQEQCQHSWWHTPSIKDCKISKKEYRFIIKKRILTHKDGSTSIKYNNLNLDSLISCCDGCCQKL